MKAEYQKWYLGAGSLQRQAPSSFGRSDQCQFCAAKGHNNLYTNHLPRSCRHHPTNSLKVLQRTERCHILFDVILILVVEVRARQSFLGLIRGYRPLWHRIHRHVGRDNGRTLHQRHWHVRQLRNGL